MKWFVLVKLNFKKATKLKLHYILYLLFIFLHTCLMFINNFQYILITLLIILSQCFIVNKNNHSWSDVRLRLFSWGKQKLLLVEVVSTETASGDSSSNCMSIFTSLFKTDKADFLKYDGYFFFIWFNFNTLPHFLKQLCDWIRKEDAISVQLFSIQKIAALSFAKPSSWGKLFLFAKEIASLYLSKTCLSPLIAAFSASSRRNLK